MKTQVLIIKTNFHTMYGYIMTVNIIDFLEVVIKIVVTLQSCRNQI